MSFSIYQITYRLPFGTGKRYVGLTQRTLKDRLNAHFNESTREKPRGISPFHLGYAIRDHLQKFPDVPPTEAFVIELLKDYASLDEMRDGEGFWIDTLKTMAPDGFNLMRGGSSVGGPSNAKPCEIFLGDRLQTFSSFTAAAKAVASSEGIVDPNEIRRFIARASMKMRGSKGKPESKYSLAEALGIEPREDGRRTDLSRAAKASGRSVDTERSRYQRQKLRDKRLADGVNTGKLPSLDDPSQLVSQKALFETLGISASTGRFRLAQIAARLDFMTPREIHDHLRKPQDRSKPITVDLPNGQRISHGVNALANLYARPGHSFSNIKARLLELGANPYNNDLLIAIGLANKPVNRNKAISVQPTSRKKHCSDWTISKGVRTKTYANQKAFIDACHKALRMRPDRSHWLGKNPADINKTHRSLQFRISSATRVGKTPQQLAEAFSIVDDLLEN
ncbi:hypothetical protein PS858_00410 [Pseudomonas fluorescens]|uniref:GIY-YIG nuclease family protein n=1 Tax=Pseudomonas fluorescens TaxID=294 RepID=UPI001242A964|nr:GIY-YIG nuclease family protein [Pseudomonas fluorescens]VVO53637.1 hypothetical protein PS858_00410 [Pseudomonas fluorescens]